MEYYVDWFNEVGLIASVADDDNVMNGMTF